jgi:hypothetical protein
MRLTYDSLPASKRAELENNPKFDANNVAFINQQLRQIETRLYQAAEQPKRYREVFPVKTDTNPGAETVSYILWDRAGVAKIAGSDPDDIPRVDVFATEHIRKIKNVVAEYVLTDDDVRKAAFGNVALNTQKASMLGRAHETTHNDIAFKGDSTNGLPGFFDNPNIPIVALPNGAQASSTWASKTPLEMLVDVRLLVSNVKVTSADNWTGNFVLLLPQAQDHIISMTPMDAANGSNITIKKFILENDFGISRIETLTNELDNVFTNGTEDGCALFPDDEEVLQYDMPMALTMKAPQERNLATHFIGVSKSAGLVVRFPIAITFGSGL